MLRVSSLGRALRAVTNQVYIKKKFFLRFIFERERETDRQNMSWRGAEREGDPESEAGSRL